MGSWGLGKMDATKTGIVMGRHDAAKKERAKQFRQAMTPAEAALWQHLRTNKLDGLHFRRQQIINGLIADFYCHEAGLVVEVDGTIHDMQADADAERDRILSARGLRVLRFSNSQVLQELPACLAAIRQEPSPTLTPNCSKGTRFPIREAVTRMTYWWRQGIA